MTGTYAAWRSSKILCIMHQCLNRIEISGIARPHLPAPTMKEIMEALIHLDLGAREARRAEKFSPTTSCCSPRDIWRRPWKSSDSPAAFFSVYCRSHYSVAEAWALGEVGTYILDYGPNSLLLSSTGSFRVVSVQSFISISPPNFSTIADVSIFHADMASCHHSLGHMLTVLWT